MYQRGVGDGGGVNGALGVVDGVTEGSVKRHSSSTPDHTKGAK